MKKILLSCVMVSGLFAGKTGVSPASAVASIAPDEGVLAASAEVNAVEGGTVVGGLLLLGGALGGAYVGTGGGTAEIRDGDVAYVSATLGYNLNNYIGAEFRGFYGSHIDNIAGYLKLQYPIQYITPYFLAGYGHTNYKDHPYVYNNELDAAQYGVGLKYNINPIWGLSTDVIWINPNSSNEIDDHILTVQALYNF